jgi:hypothetical protein
MSQFAMGRPKQALLIVAIFLPIMLLSNWMGPSEEALEEAEAFAASNPRIEEIFGTGVSVGSSWLGGKTTISSSEGVSHATFNLRISGQERSGRIVFTLRKVEGVSNWEVVEADVFSEERWTSIL